VESTHAAPADPAVTRTRAAGTAQSGESPIVSVLADSATAPTAQPIHRGDAGSRSRTVLLLQRSAGNASVGELLRRPTAQRQSPVQRQSLGPGQPVGHQQPVVQRSPENEKALAAIQGGAMFALLPDVARLPPEVRADEAAAAFVGGPRLVVAIHAVNNKGNWKAFAAANTTEMAQLPLDQIDDLMRYVGAPADVRTFDRSKFDSRFDALVDPTTGTMTLIMKIRMEMVEGQSYSGDPVGSKGWEQNNLAAFQKFGPSAKAAIEAGWSGTGPVKPVTKGLKVPSFATRVTVVLVDGGEHISFKVYGVTASVRSNVDQHLPPGATKRSGELQVGDDQKKKTSLQHRDGAKVNNEQVTVAHEFGHAMGLDHVAGPAATGDKSYGIRQSEYADIMGGGMSLGPTAVGSGKTAATHDNLKPFETIGEVWGKEVFPGPLAAKLSIWGPA
jgi:hypothetical protein